MSRNIHLVVDYLMIRVHQIDSQTKLMGSAELYGNRHGNTDSFVLLFFMYGSLSTFSQINTDMDLSFSIWQFLYQARASTVVTAQIHDLNVSVRVRVHTYSKHIQYAPVLNICHLVIAPI